MELVQTGARQSRKDGGTLMPLMSSVTALVVATAPENATPAGTAGLAGPNLHRDVQSIPCTAKGRYFGFRSPASSTVL